MPQLLVSRLGDDTLENLEAAARQRLDDAIELQRAGRLLPAIYLYGYSVEMRVKAGYFRAHGFGPAQTITQKNRAGDALSNAQKLGLARPRGHHDILWWATLLVATRSGFGRPHVPALAQDVVTQAGIVSWRWSEIMRYRTNIPYAHETMRVMESALWFESNRKSL